MASDDSGNVERLMVAEASGKKHRFRPESFCSELISTNIILKKNDFINCFI